MPADLPVSSRSPLINGGERGERKLHGLKLRPVQGRILCLVFTMMVRSGSAAPARQRRSGWFALGSPPPPPDRSSPPAAPELSQQVFGVLSVTSLIVLRSTQVTNFELVTKLEQAGELSVLGKTDERGAERAAAAGAALLPVACRPRAGPGPHQPHRLPVRPLFPPNAMPAPSLSAETANKLLAKSLQDVRQQAQVEAADHRKYSEGLAKDARKMQDEIDAVRGHPCSSSSAQRTR